MYLLPVQLDHSAGTIDLQAPNQAMSTAKTTKTTQSVLLAFAKTKWIPIHVIIDILIAFLTFCDILARSRAWQF